MPLDMVSYSMGKKRARGKIELSEDSDYMFTDDGEGNITIEESE